MKKILITGGAGFIGYPLTKQLSELGYDVSIFDNLSNTSSDFISYQNLIGEDITEKENLNKAIENIKPDFLIHLAALHYIPDCMKDPIKTQSVNVTGTKNILDAIKTFSPKTRFIFTSSAAIYAPSEKALMETSDVGPVDIYGQTKLEAENLIKEYTINYDIEYTILRLFNVYGSGDRTPHLIPAILNQLKTSNDVSLGNTRTKRDYIYVNDVISGFVGLIQKKETGKNEIFNLGTGQAFSAIEVVENIIQLTRRKIKIIETKNMVRQNDRPTLLGDASKARNNLSWKQEYSFKKGLSLLLKKEGLL
jgi:UDP-glucose 4-epimerase